MVFIWTRSILCVPNMRRHLLDQARVETVVVNEKSPIVKTMSPENVTYFTLKYIYISATHQQPSFQLRIVIEQIKGNNNGLYSNDIVRKKRHEIICLMNKFLVWHVEVKCCARCGSIDFECVYLAHIGRSWRFLSFILIIKWHGIQHKKDLPISL